MRMPLGNVGIHAARISFKETAIACAGHFERLAGRGPQAQNALFAVESQQVTTKDLGQFSASGTADRVHLPEPVLSSHVALREKEILHGGGINCWYAMGIPGYSHGCRKSGHLLPAIQSGERSARNVEHITRCRSRNENDNQQRS